MRNKVIIILSMLIVIFCFLLKLSYDAYMQEKATKERYYTNMKALTDSTKYYRNEYGNLVAVNSGLEFTSKELKEVNAGLYKKTENQGLKIKNLENIIHTISETNYSNKDTIKARDTVYINSDGNMEKLSVFSYSDQWIKWEASIKNCAILDPDAFKFESKDSIIILPKVDYKGCWFWKKPIGILVHTSNANPYSKTEKTEYIKLRK